MPKYNPFTLKLGENFLKYTISDIKLLKNPKNHISHYIG